jgi:hypothetical protein
MIFGWMREARATTGNADSRAYRHCLYFSLSQPKGPYQSVTRIAVTRICLSLPKASRLELLLLKPLIRVENGGV